MKKIIKYKNKYQKLKVLHGGLEIVGEMTLAKVETFRTADITLLTAHGKIDINKWSVVPENVYILTTAMIGNTTCKSNTVYGSVINDNLKRDKIIEILSTQVCHSEAFYKERPQKLCNGGYILYEPGDFIPDVSLSFSNGCKGTDIGTYAYLNVPPYENVDTKNNILNDYIGLIRTPAILETDPIIKYQAIKITDTIDIEYLVDCIRRVEDKYKKYKILEIFNNKDKIIKDEALTHIVCTKISGIKYDYVDSFIDPKRIKKIINPNQLSEEDCKFINMILTLLNYTKDKFIFTLKEIIDGIENSSEGNKKLIIMTACLVPQDDMYHFIDFYRNPNITVPIKISDIDDIDDFEEQMIDDYYPNILLKSKYKYIDEDPTIDFSGNKSKKSRDDIVKPAVKKNRYSLLYAGNGFKFNPANNDYIKSVIKDINKGIISDPMEPVEKTSVHVEPQVKKGKK